MEKRLLHHSHIFFLNHSSRSFEWGRCVEVRYFFACSIEFLKYIFYIFGDDNTNLNVFHWNAIQILVYTFFTTIQLNSSKSVVVTLYVCLFIHAIASFTLYILNEERTTDKKISTLNYNYMHNAWHLYKWQVLMIASFTSSLFPRNNNQLLQKYFPLLYTKKRACIDIWCLIYSAPLRNIRWLKSLFSTLTTNCCLQQKLISV